MVGLFLAMLELIKSNLIKAEQNEQCGPIYVRALTDEPAEQAVQNSIIANLEIEEEENKPTETTEQAPAPQEPPIPIQEIPA